MTGYGTSGGALSLVNAVSSGFGGAFGIALSTRAQVTPSYRTSLVVNGNPADTTFLEALLDQFNTVGSLEHAEVAVTSSIPEKVGLKSSSAAGNAILQACANAVSVPLSPQQILAMNATASMNAGISITGAYDDAAACLMGGAVLTDNGTMRIIRQGPLPETLRVFIVIPPGSGSPSVVFPRHLLDRDASLRAFETAVSGDIWRAMRENGALVADVLGISNEIAESAMQAGALSAGISGTGPAVGIVVEERDVPSFLRTFAYPPTITTRIRNWRI